MSKDDLTDGERAEIQAIVDEFQTTIYVVGSRASGTGRNVDSQELLVGKGENTRSDIDFRIDAEHPRVDELIEALKGVSNGAGSASRKHNTNQRATQPPYVRFTPGNGTPRE